MSGLPRYLYVLMLFCLLGKICRAGHESYTGTSGPNLAVSDTFSVADPKYFSYMCPGGVSSTPYFTNHKVVDRVSLDLNYLSTAYTGSPFTVTAQLEVMYNVAGTCPSSGRIPPSGQNFTITLKISYNPKTGKKDIDENSYVFKNDYHFIVKILSISSSLPSALLSDMVRIDGYIDIDRYYPLSAFPPTFVGYTGPKTPNEKVVQWGLDSGAEAYQLEWRWFDINKNYLYNSNIWFKDSSTRVTITAQAGNALPTSYKIPLIYEHGYVVCRVRAIGRGGRDFTVWKFGPWSLNDNTTTLGSFGPPGTISGSDTGFVFPVSGFQDSLNWQYTGSFTEDGKKKTLISFFDGSLRERQTITKNYTTNRVIAAEDFYDHVGRKAVSALPVPLNDSVLKYHKNLNLDHLDSLYSWKDFELVGSGDSCNLANADSMVSSSGSSKYYSSRNGLTDFHRYLPNAGSYPFAQTEYMPDNTSRIRRQGGVGRTYQLNSGHETKYFYGVPLQQELDALFGSDVGFASRYKKNMVIDANGQISVSYLDAHGRVVATALGGARPTSLERISSNTGDILDTSVNLLDSVPSLEGNTETSVLNYPLLVTIAGSYNFTYQFTPEEFTDVCIRPSTTCYDCVYDLNIVITNECNQVVSQVSRYVGHWPADTICGNNLDSVNELWTVSLGIGSYTIHKSLTIDDSALDYYTDKYIKEDTCLKTYAQFYSDALSRIDFSGCNAPACTTCQQYNSCQPAYQMMLGDVSPGGQYAEFYRNSSNGVVIRDTFPLSVLNANASNLLPHGDSANWKHPHTPYLDAAGVRDSVMLNGINYPPESLPDMFTFVQNWKPSWAASLVYYHPEYPYYQWCINNRANGSDAYDSAMMAITSYSTAKSLGYFNPLGMTSSIVNPTTYASDSAPDPFFTHVPNMYKAYVKRRLQKYYTSASNTTYSMWQAAIGTATCKSVSLEKPISGTSEVTLQSCLSAFNTSATGCISDSVWQTFKIMYLSEKTRIKNILLNEYALVHRGFNGCIGTGSSFQFTLLDTNYNEQVVNCFNGLSPTTSCPSNLYSAEADPLQPCSGSKSSYYAAKQRRFDPEFQVFNQNVNNHDNSVVPTLQTDVTDSAKAGCVSQCQSYVPSWEQALANCGMSPTTMQNLMDTLVNICSYGCDNYNPLGSSSAAPRVKGGYQTFDQAIRGMSGHSSYDTSCSDLLISMPQPYGHNYGFYQDTTGTNTPSCSNNSAAQPTAVCISCSRLRDAIDDFNSKYPGASTSTFYHASLTNYLNGVFNSNYLFEDYDSLKRWCDSMEPVPVGCFLFGPGAPPPYTLDSDTAVNIQAFLNLIFGDTTNSNIFRQKPFRFTDTTIGTFYPADTQHSFMHNLLPHDSACQPRLYVQNEPYLSPFFEADIFTLCDKDYKIQLRFPDFGYDAKNLFDFNNIRMYNLNEGVNYSFLIDAKYKHSKGIDSLGRYIYDTLNLTLVGTTSWQVGYCRGTTGTSYTPSICATISAANSNSGNPNSQIKEVHFGWEGDTQEYCTPFPISSCGCDKIFKAMKEYNQEGGNSGTGETFQKYLMNGIPQLQVCSPHPNMSDLFHHCMALQGYTDSTSFVSSGSPPPIDKVTWNSTQVLDSLRAQDSRGIKMPGALNCAWGPIPDGPDAPSASTCIPCLDINNVVSNAIAKISNDSIVNNSPQDSISSSDFYNKVSGILSAQFSRNMTAVGKADSSGCTSCSQGMYVCQNVTVQALYLDSFLRQLCAPHHLTRDTDITNFKYFNFYLKPNDSFSCATYNYHVDTFSEPVLKVHLTGTCGGGNFSCYLKLTAPTSGVFLIIDSFRNIRVYQGAPGSTYSFMIDAYHAGLVSTLTGSTTCYPIAQCCGFSVMCPSIKPRTLTIDTSQCRASLKRIAEGNAFSAYNRYLDSVKASFRQRYIAKCMAAHEKLIMNMFDYRYHFTLYYYDQGGNLVKTVPPKGVTQLSATQCAIVYTHRTNNGTRIVPTHTLLTRYRYNSLNEQVWTQSPNSDSAQTWYDNLGRVVASQGGRQRPLNLYSYTIYDKLGRITEVGETNTSTPMVDSIGLKASYLASWLSGGTHKQITRTYYDSIVKNYISVKFGAMGQQFLRGRVSTIAFFNSNSDTGWAHATHYSYDPHGNVGMLMQDFPEWAMFNMRFKRMDYKYDLISQNVNEVTYQGGKMDQLHHRYEYDEDNRLIKVYTSIDSVLWDQDAEYTYYMHGPLARMNLGRLNVQGVDYAYTLQGWIKGVNSDYLSQKYDPGQDGYTSNWGLHHWVARDAYGYSLGYFNGDYAAVNASNMDATINYSGGSQSGLADTAYRQDLYNGNISHMVTAIGKFMASGQPLASDYRYDQLNRLMKVIYFDNMDTSTHTWGTSSAGTGTYGQAFTYDEDGNMLTHIKNGDGSGGHTTMDQLTYYYNSGTDQLNHVTNSVPAGYYKNEMPSEGPNNYLYDGSSNMTHDDSAQIDSIKWSPYGKVLSIKRKSGSIKPGLVYAYGADGQRVEKIVKKDGKARDWRYYWYVRDAQGNIMAVYKRGVFTSPADSTHLKDSLILEDQDMYGSSRLGIIRRDTALVVLDYTGSVNNTTTMPVITTLHSTTVTVFDTVHFTRTTGLKRYELTNHLGNVLLTVSDRHIRVQSNSDTDSTAYFTADVLNATDYYAFGEEMPGRTFNVDTSNTLHGPVDTCLSCENLKRLLDGYTGSLLDSANLTVYLNLKLGVQQSVAGYMASIRNCRILRDSLMFLISKGRYIDYPDAPQYHVGTGNFTVEAWINSTQNNTLQSILANQNDLNGFSYYSFPGIYFYLVNNDLYLTVGDGKSPPTGYLSDAMAGYTAMPSPQINAWHHVVAERTGTGKSWTDIKIWIDGVSKTVSVDSNASNGYGNGTLKSANIDSAGVLDMKVGSRIGSNSPDYFNGSIRNVRMYKRALAGSEIDSNYAHGCTGIPKDTSSLVLWAGIDYAGITVPDKSNYHATGTTANCFNAWGRRTDSACQATINTCMVPVADVSYDTCLTCAAINTAMASYMGSTSDTAAITSYLNSHFHFSQTEAQYKHAFYQCKTPTADTMNFDGNRYVDYGNNAQYKVGTENFTVEAWVNSTLNNNSQVILTDQSHVFISGYDKFTGFEFSLTNNNLYFMLADGNPPPAGHDFDAIVAYASVPQMALNSWHHVVAERTGMGKSYTDVKLWVDGQQMPVSASIGVYNGTSTIQSANIDSAGVDPMHIGERTFTSSPLTFEGSIREVRMYKRALSNSEVVANFNNGCVSEPWDTTGLVLWSPLNDGSGYTCTDESHYHATGTIRDSGSGFWGSSSSYCYFNTPVICETHSKHFSANVTVGYTHDISYPFGFVSMLKNNEIQGQDGDDYDFEDRIYDPRLGRYFSPDRFAAKYPYISPYSYCLNNPIYLMDYAGDTVIVYVTAHQVGTACINLYTVREIRKKPELALEQIDVPFYEVTVSDQCGSKYSFYFTRTAYRGKDKTNVTFDVIQNDDRFLGFIGSRWQQIDNILKICDFYDYGEENKTVHGMKGNKIQDRIGEEFHAWGASDGCLLCIGPKNVNTIFGGINLVMNSTMPNFIGTIKKLQREDKKAQNGNAIEIIFEKCRVDCPSDNPVDDTSRIPKSIDDKNTSITSNQA